MKAKIAKHVFRLLDHPKLFLGHRFAIRDAGTQAGHLRFVRGRQPKLRGEFADLGFGEAGFFERRTDLELGGGLRARAIIPHVAGVFAIGQNGEALGPGQWRQLGE